MAGRWVVFMSQSQENDYALLSEVVNKTSSAIIVVSETGVIVKANHSALNLLGEATLEGRRWVEVISKVFRPRNDDGHEISTRDGKRLQVTTASLSSGQLIQMNDLTETRLLQDKLSHMERLSSLGRMAASLAHQIRTPLSAAMLYAANLGNANLQPMARKRFQEKLVSRLESLEAQVSDILMFARSNEQTVSEVDAATLVEQACSNVTAVLTKGGAQMATQVDEGPMPILANATALTGALSNLIANAVEAGAKHVILKLTKSPNAVIFSVANDGPKIPNELKEKIFEPFYTSKSSGTGLGLAVVSAVTKVHQGMLSLDEWNETFATVFNIAIPLFKSERPQARSESSPEASSAPAIATKDSALASGESENSKGAATKGAQGGRDVPEHSHIMGIGNISNEHSALEESEMGMGGVAQEIVLQRQAASTLLNGHPNYDEGYVQSGATFAQEHSSPEPDKFSTPPVHAFGANSNKLPSGSLRGEHLASHVNFGALPPTAEGISKQAAHEANNATSQAFAAYARKRQQQVAAQKATLEQQSEAFNHGGFTQVEVKINKHH